MVDCTGLENRRPARVREFESHLFRQQALFHAAFGPFFIPHPQLHPIAACGLAPSRLRTYCTVSERVEIGKALEGELTPRHGGDRVSEQAGKFSGLNDAPKGDTRDIAAKAAGFGNGKTYATRLHSNSISRLALLTLAIDSIS